MVIFPLTYEDFEINIYLDFLVFQILKQLSMWSHTEHKPSSEFLYIYKIITDDITMLYVAISEAGIECTYII